MANVRIKLKDVKVKLPIKIDWGHKKKCVCGYDGNYVNGEWCCFNDSCGSSRPAVC